MRCGWEKALPFPAENGPLLFPVTLAQNLEKSLYITFEDVVIFVENICTYYATACQAMKLRSVPFSALAASILL